MMIEEERLDKLFTEAFSTNHPAMRDWVAIKFKLKEITRLESQLAAKERVCKWTWDAARNRYITSCGSLFQRQHSGNYCKNCGGKIG